MQQCRQAYFYFSDRRQLLGHICTGDLFGNGVILAEPILCIIICRFPGYRYRLKSLKKEFFVKSEMELEVALPPPNSPDFERPTLTLYPISLCLGLWLVTDLTCSIQHFQCEDPPERHQHSLCEGKGDERGVESPLSTLLGSVQEFAITLLYPQRKTLSASLCHAAA